AGRFAVQCLDALLDGVLVRTRERGVHQVAGVRVPLVHGQLVAVLDGAPYLVDGRQVEPRVDALAEQVERQRHEVDVAGAFTVAEQATLHAVGAGQQSQLGGGDAGTAVVVRVQRHAHVLPPADVPAEPLDLVGVPVRGGPFDRRRQVQHDLASRTGLPDVHDALADVQRVLRFGVHEQFGRV